MSIFNQCKTIAETIKHLQEMPDQNDLIIFDYISEGEIEEVLCERHYPMTPSDKMVKDTMRELDNINDFQVSVMRKWDNSINEAVDTLPNYSEVEL